MTGTEKKLTEEKRARIAELWNLGWTSSHIADAVGLSRNSVIGAVHRLRVKGAIIKTEEDRKPPRPKKVLAIRKNFKRSIPSGKPVGILDLKSNSCRFIISDEKAETLYCNHQVWKQSYCKEHYKICYTPLRKSS